MFNTSLNNGSNEKTGTVKAFGGSVAPFGWLICDGSAISRTLYAALFDVIGETYGAGDGSTTFNLPNLSGMLGTQTNCKGNGICLGLTNGTNNYGLQAGPDAQNRYILSTGMYGQNVGSGSNIGDVPTDGGHYGVTTDGTKSGIVADLTTANQSASAIIKY